MISNKTFASKVNEINKTLPVHASFVPTPFSCAEESIHLLQGKLYAISEWIVSFITIFSRNNAHPAEYNRANVANEAQAK